MDKKIAVKTFQAVNQETRQVLLQEPRGYPCQVATFKDLIKLEYPKAFPDELRAMLDFVRMLTAYEEAAATEAKAKQQQVRSASAPYPLPTTVYRLPTAPTAF